MRQELGTISKTLSKLHLDYLRPEFFCWRGCKWVFYSILFKFVSDLFSPVELVFSHLVPTHNNEELVNSITKSWAYYEAGSEETRSSVPKETGKLYPPARFSESHSSALHTILGKYKCGTRIALNTYFGAVNSECFFQFFLGTNVSWIVARANSKSVSPSTPPDS